ncbi:hypothetical protein [Streptomyces sp. NPDC006477]|uniref:hypothetical protein n=1 Tax=Streptomyces sp. NPDC006477 TaxID=3364747 RepID=UPI003681029D
MATPAFSPSHGSKAEVYYNGYDISHYLKSAATNKQRDKAEASTFKSTTKRYTVGLVDPVLALEGYFDGNRERVDDLMNEAIDAEDGVFSHFPAGTALGALGNSLLSVTTKYEITSEIGATVGVSIEASAGKSGVIDKVRSAVTDQVVSAVGNSGVIDFKAASTKVGSISVHGFTTGGAMNVVLQDSADGTTFADVATVNFTGGTVLNPVRAGKRAVTTSNLRRYARVRWDGAGTIIIAAIGR